MVWEIFAVYDTTVDFPYIIPDMPWEVFCEVLGYVSDASIYGYGITVEESDKVLTLSTCSFVVPGRLPLPHVQDDYRFVVMARLVDPGERMKNEAAITQNNTPLPPDAMPMIYYPSLDILQYDGQVFSHKSAVAMIHLVNDIDKAELIPVGEIERSGIIKDLQDLDAVKLAVGTKLFRHKSRSDILIAEQSTGMRIYTAIDYVYRPARIRISVPDELANSGEEKEITDAELLEQFRATMLRAHGLRTTEKELEKTGSRPEVRITAYIEEANVPFETTLRVFSATPMFLQQEVTVIQNENSYRFLADEEAQRFWEIVLQ